MRSCTSRINYLKVNQPSKDLYVQWDWWLINFRCVKTSGNVPNPYSRLGRYQDFWVRKHRYLRQPQTLRFTSYFILDRSFYSAYSKSSLCTSLLLTKQLWISFVETLHLRIESPTILAHNHDLRAPRVILWHHQLHAPSHHDTRPLRITLLTRSLNHLLDG